MMRRENLKGGLRKTSMNQQGSFGKNRSLTNGEILKGSLQKTDLFSKSSILNRGHTKLKKQAPNGSTRRVGDDKEAQVIDILEKEGLIVKETQNSGATNYDGDFVLHSVPPDIIRTEVKFRNSEGFTITKQHWADIVKKSVQHGGTPALITINKTNKKLITLEVKDFALLIKQAIEVCKKT